jgi:hypothetical protein
MNKKLNKSPVICQVSKFLHLIKHGSHSLDLKLIGFGASFSFVCFPQLSGAFGSTRLFSWQNFWQNTTVAVSLLFGKYCPIIV